MCIFNQTFYLLTLTVLLPSMSPFCAIIKKCNQLLEHLFLSIMNCLYRLTPVLELWMFVFIDQPVL